MARIIYRTHCLNCESPFPKAVSDDQEIFCNSCGQSSKDSRLSFGRLLKDAISNILNLDSRLIHTLRDIFSPSKLTRLYIQGKRKYYVNPVRLFIFALIGLITLTLSSITIENSTWGVDDMYARTERSKVMEDFNKLIDTLDIAKNSALIDTVKSKLFSNVKVLKTDTLGVKGLNSFISGRSMKSFGISTYDAIHLTDKELFEKYKVENFWDKIMIGQYIRVVTNPAGGIKHVVKNLTWAIFVTVFFMGFVMKLLYIRNSYYLVEHVVLILNSHSLLFLLIAFNIVLLAFVPLGTYSETIKPISIGFTFLFVFILQFLTLKKYYRQGTFKTLIKQFILNSVYLFIFNMVVLMVALISLLLY